MDTNLQIYPDKIVAENTHTDGGDGDTPVAFEDDGAAPGAFVEDDGDHGGIHVFRKMVVPKELIIKKRMTQSTRCHHSLSRFGCKTTLLNYKRNGRKEKEY